MIKDFVPPTRAEECRNTAEILRELAGQLRFADTRHLLVDLAEDLDWRANLFERRGSLPARADGARSGKNVTCTFAPKRG